MKNISIVVNGALRKTVNGKITVEYADQEIKPVKVEEVEKENGKHVCLYFRDSQIPNSFQFKKVKGIRGEKTEMKMLKVGRGYRWVFMFKLLGRGYAGLQ